MARINYESLIENFPDAFAKDENSNNYKLLQIKKLMTDKILNDMTSILSMLNMDSAYGKTLDLWYGERLNLARGKSDDIQYIVRLKAKKMQNTNDGSFPKIAEALAAILECTPTAIHIVESDTPNFVNIKDIPLEVIFNAGFTVDDITAMIENMLPLGVKIKELFFTGTFEFGGENEYDKNKGFADVDCNIGGYFGMFEEVAL